MLIRVFQHSVKVPFLCIFVFACIKRFPLFIYVHGFVHNRALDAGLGLVFALPALLYWAFCSARIRRAVKNGNAKGIALVCTIKNEAPYMREYLEYYRLIGFSRVIIYDDILSTDNLSAQIADYLSSGFADLHSVRGHGRQKDVYNDALNRYGHKYRYFAFFDVDEFLRIDGFDALSEIDGVFRSYEGKKMGALSVNMLFFGTNGHKNRPNGLVLENYLARTSVEYLPNLHLKCIADTSAIMCMHSPHFPILKKAYKSFLCNGVETHGARSQRVDASHLILYHYYSKSEEEYLAKSHKTPSFKCKQTRFVYPLEELNGKNEMDFYMLKYAKAIKESWNDYPESESQNAKICS